MYNLQSQYLLWQVSYVFVLKLEALVKLDYRVFCFQMFTDGDSAFYDGLVFCDGLVVGCGLVFDDGLVLCDGWYLVIHPCIW